MTDMAATFLDLANAEPVEGAIIDGMSILPVWKGETKELKSAILIESGFAKGVITKDFKYIAIRYNKESLKRGFIPPQSGSIPEHLKKGTFKILWEKNPFGQPRDNIGGIVDPDQLYDLRKDSKEERNLAKNPEYTKKMRQLQKQLSTYVKSIGRPFGEFTE